MGLILDSSILIHAVWGDIESALSAISIIELTHGIYRARTDVDHARRKAFVDELAREMIVHPVSLGIARLAGRVEGEQAARGISIAIEDLVIGAAALFIG